MNSTKELQDSLQEVSVVMRELKQKIPSNKKFIKTLLHIFCGVTDFRCKFRYNGVLFSLKTAYLFSLQTA